MKLRIFLVYIQLLLIYITSMQKKQEQNEKQPEEKDDFAKMLDGFNETPLNLTNEDKEKEEQEDPEISAKIKQQYDKFMKEMQAGFSDTGNNTEEPSMDGLGNALGNLLKGLTDEIGGEGEQGKEFGEKFANMFKNLDENNIEEAASNLLNEFMDKNLLMEPLQQTKSNYEQYFKKEEGKIPEKDLERFKGQYEIVLKILQVLEKNPESKSEMISLFEKMQEYGNPPEGIAPATGFM